MDSTLLASGDNTHHQKESPNFSEDINTGKNCTDDNKPQMNIINNGEVPDKKGSATEITTEIIDENEAKLKDRIAQCRNIIESLKIELNEEKIKLEKDSMSSQRSIQPLAKCTPSCQYVSSSDALVGDIGYSSMYSECVDSKLNCDENLMKYEKQLQKYQYTLNMAQIEKKNAIRKQMLSKAYRLKLMEVENQCNIELLRVKQSLQCLEPLQMIAKKWKTSNDDTYDVNNFDLIPRYPELGASSTSEVNSFEDERDMKSAKEKPSVGED